MRAEFDLALADPIVRVEDLALEVGEVDDVEVDDADRSDAGGREIEGGRAAETAGADQQRLRLEQPGLAGGADLRDEQVPAVALLLLRAEDDRCFPREAGRLPRLEPARHRRDVRVAELLERLRGEERADAASAIEDDLGVAVGGGGLDLLLDIALADVDGIRQVALLPFGRLTDVDDDRGVRGEGIDLLWRDLPDLRSRLRQEVGIGSWHGLDDSSDSTGCRGFRDRAEEGRGRARAG